MHRRKTWSVIGFYQQTYDKRMVKEISTALKIIKNILLVIHHLTTMPDVIIGRTTRQSTK